MTDCELTDALAARRIPAHMHDGVRHYVLEHIPAGDFLMGLFRNELTSFLRADQKNRACLESWIHLLVWDLPSACWGSPENVARWLDRDGP